MYDIIRTISESADKGSKCKHRHLPDMKNYADMPCRAVCSYLKWTFAQIMIRFSILDLRFENSKTEWRIQCAIIRHLVKYTKILW